jgi:hypothetical protein
MKLSSNFLLKASVLLFCSFAANCVEDGNRIVVGWGGGLGGSLGACRIVEFEPVVPFELTEAREVERARFRASLVDIESSSAGDGKGKGKESVEEVEGIGAG